MATKKAPKRGRPPKGISPKAEAKQAAPLTWPAIFRAEIARRLEMGMTLRHMAKEMGVSPQVLHNFHQRPDYSPNLAFLERMTNYFGWKLKHGKQ